MTCSNSVRRSLTATTTDNVWYLIGLAWQEGASRVCPGAAAYPVISDQLAPWRWRLVLGHVELAAAVEPLLLAKDVGGHRLPPAGL